MEGPLRCEYAVEGAAQRRLGRAVVLGMSRAAGMEPAREITTKYAGPPQIAELSWGGADARARAADRVSGSPL